MSRGNTTVFILSELPGKKVLFIGQKPDSFRGFTADAHVKASRAPLRFQSLHETSCAVQVQLSLDYPNTWCPHLIRIPKCPINNSISLAQICMQNRKRCPELLHMHVLVLDIMHQWTEQGSMLYCLG